MSFGATVTSSHDGAEAVERDADAVHADGDRQDGGREAAALAVDLDDRVALVGVDDERPDERHEERPHRHDRARRHVDEHRRRLRARASREERVAARRDVRVAGGRARDGRVLAVEAHERAGRALDAHRAEDALELQRHLRFLAEAGVDRRAAGVLVPRELGDDGVAPRREPEPLRAAPALAEVLAVEEDARPRRIGLHLEDGHVRRHRAQRRLDAIARRRVRLPLLRAHVPAEGVRVLLDALVGAGDVELDVAVGDEAVRREEVFERALVVAVLVGLGAEVELQVGLVGDVVGTRDAARDPERHHEGHDDRGDARHHRSSLMSISCFGCCVADAAGRGGCRRAGRRAGVEAVAPGAAGSGSRGAVTWTIASESPCRTVYGT